MTAMNLTDLAATYEDKPAIVMAGSGATLSYRELEVASNRIAHLFRQRGLRAGDHIAILMENCLEMFPVVWAAQRAGLLYTPVNWHLADDEAAYVVENCGARLLVHSGQLDRLASVIASGNLCVEARLTVGSTSPSGGERLADAVAGLPSIPIDDEVEGYYMFYSSGTTGRPKGILPELTGAPFGSGLNIDSTMRTAFGFGPDTVYLSPGPLYHAAPLGWSLGTVRNGGTAIVMERFDAEAALSAIERYRVTHSQFVPTMFVRMLKLPDETRARYDVSGLRVVIHAAAPCPVEVKERMIDWFGPKILEFYGATEGNGFFMITTPEWLEHRGSVGRPTLGELHICDDNGRELGPGEVGTIWMSGTAKFEYHGDAGKTSGAYNDRGWSTLGDLGHVDEDGYLYLSARRIDLILSGGVNIYPQEIEDALTMHPAVLDVAVIGLPDEEMGQRVHAVVSPADGVVADEALAAELIGYARERLAHFKAPRTVEFGEVPRLPSGKILKRALLARYEGADATQ
ncbi:acyl-CoA synthetase (AMP-forming)/AMP-acid ligase II [Rhodococcus rhodochrous J45]|uniref:Acyl-CoA synthetase (AMP-forming)/AMP-acid ligase II n=2 Tax=Rhodococcus rhodochrous TaxID=1829 RepID=A0A562E8F5_RHORH|nr:acyl-CoA synthetase (AMP-forming)/AMP-acid ligase II [Rhodococcus rhodochrous J45]